MKYYNKKKLKSKTLENTPKYDFKDETRWCKVLSCYDGDTITVAICLEKKISQIKVRMNGYDSPEMKPRLNKPYRDQEIIEAKKSKKALEDKILNKLVKISIDGFDKYGRLLGVIYLKITTGKMFNKTNTYENINNYMIKNNFGYIYNGGTKKNIDYEETKK